MNERNNTVENQYRETTYIGKKNNQKDKENYNMPNRKY